MGLAQTLVTAAGIIAIIGLLALLFCHYLGGWTWTKAWLLSSGEEKMVLTRQGTRRHFNPNGYMVSSDSDLNISGRGSFRRFDNTDNDYQLFRQGSNSSFTRYLHHQHVLQQQGQNNQIPPQPLRPAPNLPQPLTSQSSLDSVFNTAPSSPAPHSAVPKIPPPPQHTHSGSTSSSITSHASQRVASSNSNAGGNMGDGNHKNESTASAAGGMITDEGEMPDISGFAPTNPFLPLLQQASSKKSTQQQNVGATFDSSITTTHTGATRTTGSDLFFSVKETSKMGSTPNPVTSSSTSYSTIGSGLTMGEILFSAAPSATVPGSSGGIPSPLFSATPVGSPKLTARAASARAVSAQGSPHHTGSSRYNLYHQSSAENIIGSGSAGGVASPATPHSPTGTVSPASIRRASYPNRKEYTPHDTIPKSEFPQHIPYIPSMHHYHHHAKGNASVISGTTDPVRHHHHHQYQHHYLPSAGVSAAAVQPFLEEQEEPPEEPSTNHTLSKTTNTLIEAERKDLNNRIMVEAMREEIRIANEKMANATKSLMMDDVFLPTSSSSQGQSKSSTRKKSTEAGADATRTSIWNTKESGESTISNAGNSSSYHMTVSTMSTTATTAATTLTTSLNTLSSIYSSRRGSTPIFNTARGSVGGIGSSLGYSGGAIGGVSGRPTTLLQRSNSSGGSSTETDRVARCSREGHPELPLRLGDNQQPSASGSNSIMSNVVSALSGMAISSKPPAVGSYAFRHSSRSFSLRQSSTDSIGSDSDLVSPTADGALPALQRGISCESVCSDTSVILGDLDPVNITGHLCVGLEYDSETADLLVNVMEARELTGPDPDPRAPFDSYVRVYLLPDKTTNMQTRVYRKSLSPVYKEKFMFALEAHELGSRSLVFYLYATDKHTNTLIGEVELKLGDMDLSQPSVTWLVLTDTGQGVGELGEVMFSLSYLPTAERLTVVVVKARNLKFPHERETGDPFVKVYLLQRGKKVSKKKSSTKRGEQTPIFNEAMIFSIPAHVLQTIQLRITVADSLESEGRAYSIGHVIIGSLATGKPLSHWNQMLSSLRKPIAMWHSLRSKTDYGCG